MEFDPDYLAYKGAVEGMPYGYGLLRAHLLTENFLERSIRILVEKPHVLLDEGGGLGYHQKLRLVETLGGINTARADSLRRLNKIRN